MTQQKLNLAYEVNLQVEGKIYYKYVKKKIGVLSQLAFDEKNLILKAIHEKDEVFKITHNDILFSAKLENGKGKNITKYKLKGCAKSFIGNYKDRVNEVKVNGVGEFGSELRKAQKGALFALLSHWSITDEVSTIVLPTGTGKTETMLVATLADKAERTLVIVPTIDLKLQLSEKFERWGILRNLGVIPNDFPNPTILVLNKTVNEESHLEFIRQADVIVTTPGLIARSPTKIKKDLKQFFSHVYFDEAHHVKANEWDNIKNLLQNSKIVQFTATPYRNDRKPIDGKIVYNYPLSKALEENSFSKISLVTVDELHPKKKDKAIADAAMKRLLDDREKGWKDHCMMVRAEKESIAEELYDSYKEWFPEEKIVIIHNNVKNRKAKLEQIKKRQYDIVVCVDMLKEGFDFPEFKIAAVHGIHKSLSVLLQFIGRFTRPRDGLGDASFVVNYAEEKMSIELENLFQEGSGWEKVISEIADAKKEEAETLLTFLQGCKPYSGFDSPDIELNPKLVYPALSCVAYKCKNVQWNFFMDAFNISKYALSQPYFNSEENLFYFTTQKRDKVKWARTDSLKDQTWDLIVMHHDTKSGILYVGYSEKSLDVNLLVEKLTSKKPLPINGDCVFRSFDSIKRLSIVHAGIFKPANQLHRYSRLSGADVTTELTRWQEGNRSKKSDFVGIGFRDGSPVSVGASVKGKLWSPARIGDLKEWKAWCLNTGSLITDENIDSHQLLVDSAKKIQLEVFPDDIIVLATDWAEELYSRIHKLTINKNNSDVYLLAECSLITVKYEANRADFKMNLHNDEVSFFILLGGEDGFTVHGLDDNKYFIEGLKRDPLPLKKFFEENPPTMFLLNGCTISGCIHTDYGDEEFNKIPEDRVSALEWQNVNYTIESLYKNGIRRENSVQEYMMQSLVTRGARVVFNDDNSGEKADIIAIFLNEDEIRFELIHCKYSKAKSGARKSDLFEVCGQAIVSLRYKWKPEELLKHMERRNGLGVLKGKRFYYGDLEDLNKIKKALKYTDVTFEFAIAQPGVEKSNLTVDMNNFLGSIYSTIVEMTETKLKCYFNK